MGDDRDTYRQISRATGIIVGLTLVDKVLAVAKEMLTAHRFGVSEALDAFNIALAFPGVIILFLTTAFVSAFVPLYVEWGQQTSVDEADRGARALFLALALFFAVLTLLGYVVCPHVLGALGYGFGTGQRELAVVLGHLLVFLIFVDGAGILLRGLLHARKDFFSLHVGAILVNGTLIVALLAGSTLGIHALVWGTLLGTAFRTLFMGLSLNRSGFRFLPARLPGRESLTAFLALAIPLMGSELMVSSNLLIDQAMATQLDPGSVSTLRYAYRINDMPVQVIVLALSRALFPFVVERKIHQDTEALRDFFRHAVILLAFLSFPIIAVTALFAQDVVSLLLQRGAFDARAAAETARTLVLYSLGLFFYAYTFVNGTFFSAFKDVKTLFRMGCLAMLLNVLFNVLFMRWIGVQGIALSSTVTQGLISLVFVRIIRRRLDIGSLSDVLRNLGAIGFSCGAMAAAGYGLKILCEAVHAPPLLALPAIGLVLATVYLGVLRQVASDQLRTGLTLLVRSDWLRRVLGPLQAP